MPQPPVSLTNNATATSATKISFYWSDGASNGGTTIVDHTIFFDQGSNTWIQLAAGVTTKSFTTSNTLIEGNIYTFRVKARNAVGFSDNSAEISIKAAQKPD